MKVYNVVFHRPGPNWKAGEDFRQQPGVMAHVEHYAGFLGCGKLLLGGPFADPDTGGMMVADESVSREELDTFAASDPAVVDGLLEYEVRSWYVAMSGQAADSE
ncbi:MAG: hypothetical protein QGG64_25950 [Candidatus Latescibacteria bacterium]|jgi:uncharacterized protein YciI|nr:hypothetical protein [Candidatus Latescibacterota bacterium]